MKLMRLIVSLLIMGSTPLLAKEEMPQATKRSAKAWGIQTNIEVSSCDPYKIRSSEAIRKFALDLCTQLKIKSHTQPIVTHYDDDSDDEERGYAMVHLIGKALISAHFVNKTNALHLIVLSDKPYSPKAVGEFAKRYFGARDFELEVCARRSI